MAAGKRRGVKVKTAVTFLALGGVIAAALPLQWVWWRTARQSTVEIVDVLSDQIVATVRREWWDRVVATEAAYSVAASLLGPDPNRDAVRRALAAALTATQAPSAADFRVSGTDEMVAARDPAGIVVMRSATAAVRENGSAAPGWHETLADPAYGRPAVTYAGLTESGGVLSVHIGLDRFAALLGEISVGRTGTAFVVDPRGVVKVRPARGTIDALAPAVRAAAAIVAARPASAVNIVEQRRIEMDGAAYRLAFSPLEFNGWQFVVVVPEAEFLGDIEQTMTRTLVGLIGLALALGAFAALLAQRVLTRPVDTLTTDLARIERFELEEIAYRPERLQEFDRLSAALARMARGLADFGKFIPTDLVRTLLAEGMRATPGGDTREVTVLFADVAGFTKMSERMGTAVIDIVSSYLDVASREVEANSGVIDKFIGDAVMALWGAPRTDGEQATNACRAALGVLAAVKAAGIRDDRGDALRIRIGIHSGPAVVGNIGSERRLNYTAIGDTVNLASRLEGVNKLFGTSILISEATRVAAEDAITTRELAELAVVGKAESIRVHELVGMADGRARSDGIETYETALAAYRQRDFAEAIRLLAPLASAHADDGPTHWLLAECRALLTNPPPSDWRGVLVLDSK